MSPNPQTIESTFRPRARLLQLLGDQLIGTPRLAVFELVKNAYDADANNVSITFVALESDTPEIIVEDDGEGMSLETIVDVWLVPGHEYREVQRSLGKRSAKYNRLPLGEKGLGRFAVHKLGDEIEVVTRKNGCREVRVKIDWPSIIAKPFLSEAPIFVEERDPLYFTGDRTGTRITIGKLRQGNWTRGDIRRLQRQVTSISSPFQEAGSFKPVLLVPEHESWLQGIPDVRTILDRAIWHFTFRVENGRIAWRYEFRKIPGLKLEGRVTEKTGDPLLLPAGDSRAEGAKEKKKVVADSEYQTDVGPVWGEFYVYDRDRELLRLLTETKMFTDYLDENGGVRVYRDGIRVYNYGEPGDDWLGLDLRRVNEPTRNISRNIIIGAVNLDLEKSESLVEKTNREGFVEVDAYYRFRNIVLGVLSAFQSERQKDKEDIRSLTGKGKDPETAKIRKPLEELRHALDREGVRDRVEKYLTKIETDYADMQQTLLHAGMSGMNLAIVFHEVERGVRTLYHLIQRGESVRVLEEQSRDLTRLLDGFATLLRNDQRAKYKASSVIMQARKFSALRFGPHRIQLEAPVLEDGKDDFEALMSFGLVVGAINNLVDNAIYWLKVRWPELPPSNERPRRKLYLGVSDALDEGPAIIIADNGPGFQDSPERLVTPFFTRRPGGMGLGLYYANMVMELNNGALRFPKREEVELPESYDGAVIALVFRRNT